MDKDPPLVKQAYKELIILNLIKFDNPELYPLLTERIVIEVLKSLYDKAKKETQN